MRVQIVPSLLLLGAALVACGGPKAEQDDQRSTSAAAGPATSPVIADEAPSVPSGMIVNPFRPDAGPIRLVDGLVGGDIVPGPPPKTAGLKLAQTVLDPGLLWPGGVIPYVFVGFNDLTRIRAALAHVASATKHVRFVPRFNEAVYLKIVQDDTLGNGGHANMGLWADGLPTMTIGPQIEVYNIVHELGHVIGLEHEHNRPDRDQYIRINYANLSESWKVWYAAYPQGKPLTAYDYNSIMHYPARTAASLDQNVPVITRLNGSDDISNKIGFTASDVQGIEALYPSEANPFSMTEADAVANQKSAYQLYLGRDPTAGELARDLPRRRTRDQFLAELRAYFLGRPHDQTEWADMHRRAFQYGLGRDSTPADREKDAPLRPGYVEILVNLQTFHKSRPLETTEWLAAYQRAYQFTVGRAATPGEIDRDAPARPAYGDVNRDVRNFWRSRGIDESEWSAVHARAYQYALGRASSPAERSRDADGRPGFVDILVNVQTYNRSRPYEQTEWLDSYRRAYAFAVGRAPSQGEIDRDAPGRPAYGDVLRDIRAYYLGRPIDQSEWEAMYRRAYVQAFNRQPLAGEVSRDAPGRLLFRELLTRWGR